MGLPFFVTPVEPDAVASKSPEKATSGPRSSIRRQRTVRPQTRVRLGGENRRQRLMRLGMEAGLSPGALEIWVARRAPEQEDQEILVAGFSPSQPTGGGEEERSVTFGATYGEEDSARVPRDFAGINQRRHDLERLYRVRQPGQAVGRRHARPSVYDTQYPEPAAGSMREQPEDAPHPPASRRWRGFWSEAPSPPRHSILSDAEYHLRRPAGRERSGTASPFTREEILSEPGILNSLTTRRVLRQARLDGLGDRDRSLSPDGGGAWDTLLTSITPDPQPPSMASSFGSTTATTSGPAPAPAPTRSRQPISWPTSSRTEPEPASAPGRPRRQPWESFGQTDSQTPSTAGTSSSSAPVSAVTSMTSLSRSEESQVARDCEVSETESNMEDEEEEGYSFRDEISFWRSYAGVVTARADQTTHNTTTSTDSDSLGGMHRIITRLAEREDIPDEWWAGAGLSRNLRREPSS